MGYIQDLERELRRLLAEGDDEIVIKFVKEKILESYKNGLRDGKQKVGADTETTRTTKRFERRR